MADNTYRSFRRDASARASDPAPRDGLADPLAELARLIGQSDPHGGRGRDAGQSAEAFDDAAPVPGLDWAATDDEYAQQGRGAEASCPPPLPPENYHQHPSDTMPRPQARDYRDEPTRQYVPPASVFADPREDVQSGGLHDAYRDEPQPSDSRPPPLPFIPPALGGYPMDDRAQHGTQGSAYASDHAQDQYDGEAAPPRRSGTLVIVAILGLAVLGTAGAVGYRAMFGGSMLPSLPPIIKPPATPIKIEPKHDAQTGAPSQADAGTKGTGVQLVPHKEQPVDIQSANPVPRVVTTIPVISNAPDAPLPGEQGPIGSQPPPSAPPPAFAQPNNPAPPFGVTDQLAGPASAPPSGAKPIHTVTIRPDQSPAVNPAASAPPAPVPVVRPRQAASRPAREPRTASAGPLSIVPVQAGGAPLPPPRTRTAMTRSSGPMPLASPRAETSPSAGGGYAVQVSSQRSEAEAQAAFRSLQAKYPQQLRGRRAIVRRADLGAKGVYYRALVGPFASAEQAANLCSSLKAAGGSCLIQRN